MDVTEATNTRSEKLFLFVTANKNETAALLDCGENFFKFKPNQQSKLKHDANFYNIGKFGHYDVVHLELIDQASTKQAASVLSISNAIDAFHPDAVILVGVAFGAGDGKSKKMMIGDVLISKKVTDYESGVIRNGVFFSDGAISDAGKYLISVFNTFSGTWDFDLAERKAKCFLGDVLSGDKFVDDIKFKSQLFKRYPMAYGGEMEGRGAYAACRDRGLNEWIIAKGICDWGDGNTSENKYENQKTAAESVVSLLMHIFSNPNAFDKLPKNQNRDSVDEQGKAKHAQLYQDQQPAVPEKKEAEKRKLLSPESLFGLLITIDLGLFGLFSVNMPTIWKLIIALSLLLLHFILLFITKKNRYLYAIFSFLLMVYCLFAYMAVFPPPPADVQVLANYIDMDAATPNAILFSEQISCPPGQDTEIVAKSDIALGYSLVGDDRILINVSSDGQANPSVVTFTLQKMDVMGKFIIYYVDQDGKSIAPVQEMERPRGTYTVEPNPVGLPQEYYLMEGTTSGLPVTIDAQGVAVPASIIFRYKKIEADMYVGYAITTSQTALRDNTNNDDKSIIATLPKDTLLILNGQSKVDNTVWSGAQTVLDDERKIGIVQDSTTTHIPDTVAQAIIDQHNQNHAIMVNLYAFLRKNPTSLARLCHMDVFKRLPMLSIYC